MGELFIEFAQVCQRVWSQKATYGSRIFKHIVRALAYRKKPGRISNQLKFPLKLLR